MRFLGMAFMKSVKREQNINHKELDQYFAQRGESLSGKYGRKEYVLVFWVWVSLGVYTSD